MHNSNMTEKLKIASFSSNAHCGDKDEKYISYQDTNKVDIRYSRQ